MAQTIQIKMMDKEVKLDLPDNLITKSTIKSAFLLDDDAVISLSHGLDDHQKYCRVSEAGTTFLLPDGWPAIQFFVDSNKAPSRPATPADQAFVERPMSPYYPSLTPNPAPTSEAFSKWMFFLHDHLGKATVICVHQRYFVSFRHGSHLQLKLGETLKMYTADKEVDEQVGIHVSVVKINEALDFILLKSECIVVERGPSIARAQESEPFTLAGFGNEHGGLSYLPGTIHSVRDIYFNGDGKQLGPFIIGTSPSSRGDSGGGIWGSRGLIGSNYGCTTMPLQYSRFPEGPIQRRKCARARVRYGSLQDPFPAACVSRATSETRREKATRAPPGMARNGSCNEPYRTRARAHLRLCMGPSGNRLYHHLAISEAAVFSVKNIICPAFWFKYAYMEDLEKERKEEKVASPPQKKPCFTAEFEGLGTFYGSSV